MQNSAEASDSSSESREATLDLFFTPGRFALLLGVLFFVFYPDIILGSHAFFYRDAGLFGYPLAYYFRDCFWRGEIPLWNPYNDCGIPFLAQWNTLTLYPPSLFYLLVPLPWSLNFFLVGHVFLAGLGMYFLAHRWFGNRFAASVAGLAFAWNGLTLHALMWPSITVGLAWMPWLILGLEKAVTHGGRQMVWAALAGAMQMLSGAPEIIFFTWLLGGGISAGKIFLAPKKLSALARFLAVALLTVGLSAAQLFPFLELIAHGNRTPAFGTSAWSMPPWGAANFFVPLFRCTASVIGVFSQDEQQWTSSYYCGVAVSTLALWAAVKVRGPKIYFLSGAALAGIFFAMGDNGFFLPVWKKIFPAVGFIRYPIKFVIVSLFCFPLLAAAALSHLRQNSHSARLRVVVLLFFAACAVITLIVAAAFFPPAEQKSSLLALKSGATRLFFLGAIFMVISLAQNTSDRRAQLFFSFAALLLFGLDVGTHMPRQNPTVITRAYEPMPIQMSEFPRVGVARAFISREVQSSMERMAHPNPLNLYMGQRAVQLGDCNLLEKIPKVNGFFPVYLRESYEVESLLYQTNFPPRLAEFLGVSQITSAERLFAWDAQTNFMAMASIGQEPVFADDETTLRALALPEFSPREKVFLPLVEKAAVSAHRDDTAKILSAQFSAHQLSFVTQTEKTALLVVAQSFYPLWKPRVDGKPASLLRANHGFQAVEIPAGRHDVRLIYTDQKFYIGAVISGICWLACAVILLRHRKRNHVPCNG